MNQKREYIKAEGTNYLEVLAQLHRKMQPQWYLEIGVQKGHSLNQANGNTVGVDPAFRIKKRTWDKPFALHLFEETSDDFFANKHIEMLGCKFDLAFLDGMHLYEYLLRDFINTEKHMNDEGCIVLHDCLPWSANIAQRDRKNVQGRAWTGDVWKVVAILQKYRPDLKTEILDAKPTGLVLVSNLNPQDNSLSEQYESIIEEFDQEDDLLGFISGLEVQQASRALEMPVAKIPAKGSLSFALKTNVPKPSVREKWGDYHFAVGLQSALTRLGHRVSVRTKEEWSEVTHADEIDLSISGLSSHPKRQGRLHLQWMISSSNADEGADHTFVASAPTLQKLRAEHPERSYGLLPQAFDCDRFPEPIFNAKRNGAVFVGIARKWRRPILDYAIEAGIDLKVWGNGWNRYPEINQFVYADRIANSELWREYRSAEVVLNDHTPFMLENGFVSNRVFDALACATPVISDNIPWMPDELRPFVSCVSNAGELKAAMHSIQNETTDQKAARYEFAVKMRSEHSFDARAAEISKVARQLASPA